MHSQLVRELERNVRVFGGGLVDRQRHLGRGGERNAFSEVHLMDMDFKVCTAELRQSSGDSGLNFFG